MKQIWNDIKERWPVAVLAVLWVIGFILINW